MLDTHREASTIMLVEDEKSVQRLLGHILEMDGFRVAYCDNGEEAISRFDEYDPDLVLLDLMLPQSDGLAVSKALKAKRPVPVIVMSAKQGADVAYESFKSGAEDFVAKPFDPVELLYRIKVFLRLASTQSRQKSDGLEVGGVSLHPARCVAVVRGKEIKITRMEAVLMQYLMTHAGEVFSAGTLATDVFKDYKARECTDDAIHAHIKNIRYKIEENPKSPTIIVTVGRKGYSFAK